MEQLASAWHVWVVAALLAAIAVGFIARFILPALRLGRELTSALRQLQEIGREQAAPEALAAVMTTPTLAHLWREYAQTLHRQQDANGVRWRATAMAEAFFTEQALVDTPLKTEFYKHLPGILTGIGIIGTFSGLILGLTHFEISANTEIVRESLRGLVQGVGHAFAVSASAIALAMLFTWIEKSLVTARYHQVATLVQRIDSLFDAGAGEEYLARLVRAAEASAAAGRDGQGALVKELRVALQELLSSQQQAAAQQQQQLLDAFGERLDASLQQHLVPAIQAPLRELTASLQQQGQGQQAMLAQVLEGSLSQGMQQALGGFTQNFAEQLDQRLDSNFASLQSALQASADAMQTAAIGLQQAIGNLAAGSRDHGELMQEQLQQALTQLTAQQQSTTNELRSFLGQVGRELRQSADSQQQQQGRFADQAGSLVGELATQVRALTQEVRQASATMQATVSGVAQVNREALGQLVTGANNVRAALADFAALGREMQGAVQAFGQAHAAIRQSAGALGDASNVAVTAIAEHQQARESFTALLGELRGVVDSARREASLTEGLVARLEAGADRLGVAGKRADLYLDGVTKVLGEAHTAFATNVEATLKQGNAQFQRELAEAVGFLKGAIEDLGDAVDGIASTAANVRR
jgi:hypothetical protein